AYEQELGRSYPRPEPRAGSGRADSLNNSAVSLLDLDRLDEAMALWNRALDAEPQHLEATYNRTVFEWTRGRLDDGELERRLGEARSSHLREARAHALTARVLQGLGEHERAAAAHAEAQAAGGEGEEAPAPSDLATTFRGLTGPAQALVVTPDRALAIAGGGGREARVWDLASGALVRKLTSDDGKLRALAVTADGRLLLWAADGAPLRAFDLAQGKPARTFQLVAGTVHALALLADGRHVVAAMSDRTLRVFDLGSGQCVRTLEGHEDAVVAVAAGPTRIASGSRDGSVRLWDAASGALLAVHRLASGRVQAVALDEARGRLAAGGDDRVVSLWPRLDAPAPLLLRGPTQPVSALAFDPAGRFLVVGSLDRSLRFFSLLPTALHSVSRLDTAIHALAVLDGLVLAAHGGLVSRVVAPERPRWPPLALCRPASAAEIARRQTEFDARVEEARDALVAGELGAAFDATVAARAVPGFQRAEAALMVWDELAMRLPGRGLRAAWEERAFAGHTDAILAVAASAAGDFASAGTDRSLRVVDPDGSTRVLGVHEGPVAALAFTLEGQKLLSAGWDQVLRVWDVADGQPLATLQGHTGYVVALALSHDGRRVATGSLDHTVRLWRLDGRLERSIVGHEAAVAAVAWSPDGRVVASAGWDETVRLWDAEKGHSLGVLAGHRGNVNAVAVSPAGVALASGGADGTVRLWDPRERKEVRALAGHPGEVTALLFSADGHHLLSAGRDGTARVWNLARGACVRVLAHPAPVLALALVPLQQRLLTGGADRQLRVWRLDWELERPEDPIRLKPQTVRLAAPEPAIAAGPAALAAEAASAPAETRVPSTPAARPVARPSAVRPTPSPAGTNTPRGRAAATPAPGAEPTPAEWADVRKAVPKSLLRAPAAARTWPWRRLAVGGAALIAAAISALVWLGPSRKLRFVDKVVRQARAEVDLIELAAFQDGCDGDYAATLERAVSANASAPDIACLAAFADPGVVADYLAAAPLFGEDGRDTERLRRNALSLLVGLGESGTPGLCDALADERDEVRALVARALALQPTPGARDCLARTLRGQLAEARAAAVRELPRLLARGDIALEPGFAQVQALLTAPEPAVRAAAVSTLPIFDIHHARPLAETAQQDRDAAVRQAAETALRQITAARVEEERDGVR
ncbi:MAG: hypothetical protein NDJ94_18785, partial [Vicinamibacteria bacterium]|nr:hypothetical protein [Vicinamibacteria bacterium]